MAVKKLLLAEWIERDGIDNIRKALKVTEGAVRHWQRGYVLPRASVMIKIEKLSGGAVLMKDMITHHFSHANDRNRWERLK